VECLDRLRQRCPELPEDCKAFWGYFCVKYPEHLFKKHHTGLVPGFKHLKGGLFSAIASCDLWHSGEIGLLGAHRSTSRATAHGYRRP
jgi:hypothetical protein